MVEFNLPPIDPTLSQQKPDPVGNKNKGADGASFGQWLEKSINAVNQMQKEADSAALKLVNGENKDIHGTMISMQKADVYTNLMMEVRNKIISAYDEIKRMQF